MGRNWRTAAAVGCLAGMLTSLVPSMAQQPAPNARPAGPAAQAAPPAGATPARQVSARQAGDQPQEEVEAGQIEWNGNHTVNLDREGNVNGRLSLLDPRTGRPTPVENAVVSFAQNGRLVTQARPGSDGTFTVRLRPGVYSVIAQSPAGFGAFAVVVKPYDPEATDPQELSLDGTLIPNADIQAANAPPGGPLGPPPGVGAGGTMGGGGFTGGGGGGSQGGLGGLLGLAPLAALAALAGNDDDGGAIVTTPPASPAAP